MITKQARGIRPSKAKKLERSATRPEDMPPCATCGRVIYAAAVQGYDGRWRDLPCHHVHIEDVFLAAGESAPVASDESNSFAPVKSDPKAEEKRQKRAQAVLDKYGMVKR